VVSVALGGESHWPETLRKASVLPLAFLSGNAIVELFGTPEIPDRHEDVVNADHFHRRLVSPSSEILNGASVV
jgi:hypothetical protein